MANPAGESSEGVLRLDFDSRLMLQCGLASVNKAVVPHEIISRSDELSRAADIPKRDVNH
jgi:hypothetical protein